MARALAVDDETASGIVLVRILGALGFEVAEASDVPEAIAKIRSTTLDLVVSDYLVPSGIGLDLAQSTKQALNWLILIGRPRCLCRELLRLVGQR